MFAADAQRRAADSHAEAADAGGTSVRAPAIPKSERAVRAKGMEPDFPGPILGASTECIVGVLLFIGILAFTGRPVHNSDTGMEPATDEKKTCRSGHPAAKTVLRLPDLEHAKAAVLNSLASAESRRSYEYAIRNFVQWYCSEPRLALNRIVVTRYRMGLEQLHLAPSTINQRLAAVRRLAYEAADAGLLSPELAAGISRVKGVKKLGVRLGNWLTAEQARAIVDAPEGGNLRGKRDRAILAVLLGCGLRRSELVHLTVEHVQQREHHWAIVDLVGKGGHVRTIPMPEWIKKLRRLARVTQ